jgi:glucose dehydrogenase
MKLLYAPTLALGFAAFAAHAQVTFDRIVNAEREPQNWLSYSATLDNQRYSRLDSINTQNVANLELQWVWQARSLEKFEATPLVVDGILYTVQAPNDVVALDAATGRVFWSYHHEPSPAGRPCCGRVNRGLAILGDTPPGCDLVGRVPNPQHLGQPAVEQTTQALGHGMAVKPPLQP